MNSKKLFTELALKINLPEQAGEINQFVFMVMEHVFGLSSTEILAGKKIIWDQKAQSRIQTIIDRLNRHEPIQYILGEAEFCGRKFLVNPSVLIPRPETEELVNFTVPLLKEGKKLLDIGTGSGCIAIALKLEIPGAEIFATDISDEALTVAKQNASNMDADVTFINHDVLSEEIPFLDLDFIVSNPPYIALTEKKTMQQNVVEYEPHPALFVPDDDSLIFFRAIAAKGKNALRAGGMIVVEINERLGKGVTGVFSSEGYTDISVCKDINEKDRIVSARLK